MTPSGRCASSVCHRPVLALSAESDGLIGLVFLAPFLKRLDEASRQTGLSVVCSEITHKQAGRVTAVPSQRLSSNITLQNKPERFSFPVSSPLELKVADATVIVAFASDVSGMEGWRLLEEGIKH